MNAQPFLSRRKRAHTLRCLMCLAAVGVLVVLAGVIHAAAPWQGVTPFSKRVEADPKGNYTLTDQNGPWMILATTFQGPEAKEHAQQLVVELRKKYKLVAYTHDRTFDFTVREIGQGLDRYGAPKRMRPVNDTLAKEKLLEVAVLVGDYPSVDDADAQATLKKIKFMTPDCLTTKDGKNTSQALASLRKLEKEILIPANPNDPRKSKGPMGHAFVTSNPLLPPEYYAPKGVDKAVLEWNRDVKYSLLDCKGRYTVKVATFSGNTNIDQRQINDLKKDTKNESIVALGKNGKPVESKLEQAADKAHRMTTALRARGFEAYEFHDRFTSIVTVGSFDSVGTPRADGKTEINPQIYKIMNAFGAKETKLPAGAPGGAAAAMKAEYVAGIPLDVQPMPVEVPRRSFATDYTRN